MKFKPSFAGIAIAMLAFAGIAGAQAGESFYQKNDHAPAASPAVKTAASGFFRVAQKNGVWWFVEPNGKLFFSAGVNVVDTGASREDYKEEFPEYASFRRYSSDEAWAKTAIARLRSWNFNTIGGWSSGKVQRGEMPYAVVLHLGSYAGAPWCDLFSEEVERRFDNAAREQALPLKDDPRLLGYFTDNELGWWDETLFNFFLNQPESNASRQALMRLLRNHYHKDFSRLSADFETGGAKSFEELEHSAQLTLKLGGQGIEVIDKFTYLFAERYYQLAYNSVRRYDPNHLILGDRFQGWYPRAVAQAASKYVDVISTNYGAEWTDGALSKFYLDTLHRLTGKPILISEFYFAAMENRSGNKNSKSIFPTVQTQQGRAKGFRSTLASFAAMPFVVGAHWFQYYDEPAYGRRSDGEDYNMGLVDINDRPYEELTAAARLLRADKIHSRAAVGVKANRNTTLIPMANADHEAGLNKWNKERAFVENSAGEPYGWRFADLYASWDSDYIYLAVHAAAFIEPQLYAGNKIPKEDRLLWTIETGGNRTGRKKLLQIYFGPGGEPTIEGPPIVYRKWNGSTRFTMLVKLPASLLGRRALQAGDKVKIRSELVGHSGAERMEWDKILQFGRAVSKRKD